ISGLFTTAIVSTFLLIDSESRNFLSAIASSNLILYSSILVAVGGIAYISLNAYMSYSHIKILIRSTKIPFEYANQLRAATTLLLSIIATHSVLITGFQLFPATDWEIKLPLGIM
ncbi:hypothetical protein QWI17_09965, partial [Gilvimarinus sp. SDUM040013]|uniref:hypothetical protein n=1 Tax=Gilvimarinus gilvus TaxID=3058038 RepID=UPI002674200E